MARVVARMLRTSKALLLTWARRLSPSLTLLKSCLSLERDVDYLDQPDFPDSVSTGKQELGAATANYATIIPIKPFYRIYFDDKSYFDYDGDPAAHP